MATNYVIGIGGTGARVIESLVHCCAAGLGPDSLSVFLIDPDDGNGNLTRTKELITTYQDCQRIYQLSSPGGRQLFKTVLHTPEQLTWGILEAQNTRLAEHIHLPSLAPEVQDLAKLLFTPDELEYPLNEGFRGHPSIGATIMASAEEEGPWKMFWDDVRNAQRAGSIRALLVGSVFGGTGAAGIPTFGSPDMLKFREGARLPEAGTSKIRLGAALVLPYFLFDMDAAATERAKREMCVTPSDFPMATKVALEYYDTKALAFDDVYLVGDDGEPKVGEFSPGAREQKNRPHYVELVTAFAAFDFFRGPANDSGETTYFLAGRSSAAVDWDALPVTRDDTRLVELQREAKHALVAMTVFAYGFATYGRANFEKRQSAKVDHYWHRQRFSDKPGNKGLGVIDETARVELGRVATYSAMFLEWMAQLDADDSRLALVRGDSLGVRCRDGVAHFETRGDDQQCPIPVFLKASGSGGGDGSQRVTRSHDLVAELNSETSDDPNASAAARYVNLFYRAAVRFTESAFGITTVRDRA